MERDGMDERLPQCSAVCDSYGWVAEVKVGQDGYDYEPDAQQHAE
jgi:hypothetical protein